MLVGSQHKLTQIHDNFTVKVNTKYKSLGVHIDDSLTWRPHIDVISKKKSGGLAVSVRRVSSIIPLETGINMYNALVMPYFNYCSPFVAILVRDCQTNSKSYRIELLELLPFLVMMIAQVNYWMNLVMKRLKQLAVVMYEVHNDLSPPYLKMIFTNIPSVYSHNLRNSRSNCCIPRPRTESAKGSFHYWRSVLWNKIPLEIRQWPNLNDFKTSLNGKDFCNLYLDSISN